MTTTAEQPDIAAVNDLDLAAEGVFDAASGQFKGGKCESCGALSVPRKFICHACNANIIDQVLIPATGNLYSYTTLHVSATLATPYTLGYIDLESGVRVLGHIASPADRLGCDVPVAAAESSASPTGWAFVLQTEGTTND